ncbi:helix-turn-helix transcriptional regulator [Polaribacter sp. Z014]|uniref:helix-turn-helix transcriptional regulator n=1 Tax=Polaribacter sp. Z014 TaxID=2927126 RepID=UPI0020207C67|nr:helix-turn-helix transcriptional regulator [Polaribacter sp. Z014]MCL7765051.1 helix-turn-helix transcriptional regulator [Polaribacter sp. Z014]
MINWDRENNIAQFVRERRKKAKLTQVELSDFTGVGLRFVRELEQGKTSLMSDKVNQVLLFFGHTLTPTPISDETRRNMGK